MPKILITGVGGFIGSHLARRYLSEGWKVFGIDDLSNGKEARIPTGVDFILGDLSKKKTISKIPKECKKILHLAGQSSGEISFDDPEADLKKNTISTLNLIENGIKNRVERLVYASSMSVYGAVPEKPTCETQPAQPLSCYGVGKLASENYLRIFGTRLPWVSLRMFNVYGPGQDLENLRQGMVSIYLAQALKTHSIKVKGDLGRYRDFIFIDDVVESWFQAGIRKEALGHTINVGTGIRITVRELLEKIQFLIPAVKIKIKENTKGDQYGIYSNNLKLKKILGISNFTSLESGLKKFLNSIQTKT